MKLSLSLLTGFVASAALASAQSIDFLPWDPTLPQTCKDAFNQTGALGQLVGSCGGSGLLTIASAPGAFAVDGSFVLSLCSSDCASAVQTFSISLYPYCGTSSIFLASNNPSDSFFSTVLGGITVPEIALTISALTTIGCLRDSSNGQGYCLLQNYANFQSKIPGLSQDPNNTAAPSLLSIFPPVSQAQNQNVMCTSCVQRQYQTSTNATTFSFFRFLKPYTDALSASVPKCPGVVPVTPSPPPPSGNTTNTNTTTPASPSGNSTQSANATGTASASASASSASASASASPAQLVARGLKASAADSTVRPASVVLTLVSSLVVLGLTAMVQ